MTDDEALAYVTETLTRRKMVLNQTVSLEMWGDHGSPQIVREIVTYDLESIAAKEGGTLVADSLELSDVARRWIYPMDDDGYLTGEPPFEVVDTRWVAEAEGPDGWAPTGVFR